MASNSLGSLTLDLVAKTAPFSKGMKKAEKDLNAFGVKAGQTKKQSEGISKGLGTLSAGFVGVGVAAGVAAAKVAEFGVKAAVAWTAFSVKAAADAESVKVSLETMLGSAEAANSAFDKLFDFSKRTPFEPDEVFAGGRQLLGAGFNLDQAMSDLKLLGDIAAGSQSDLGGLIDAFAQVGATGRTELSDVQKFATRTIPIFGALAESMGVSKEEVRGLVSSGQVGLEELRSAFESLTREGGIYAGAMEEQSKTLNGLWSTLTGNVKAGAAAFGEAFSAGTNLKGLLGEMNTTLESIKWEDMGESAADAFRNILTASNLALTGIQMVSKGMALAQKTIFDITELTGRAIEGVGVLRGGEAGRALQQRGQDIQGVSAAARTDLEARNKRWDDLLTEFGDSLDKFDKMAERGFKEPKAPAAAALPASLTSPLLARITERSSLPFTLPDRRRITQPGASVVGGPKAMDFAPERIVGPLTQVQQQSTTQIVGALGRLEAIAAESARNQPRPVTF